MLLIVQESCVGGLYEETTIIKGCGTGRGLKAYEYSVLCAADVLFRI